jgi:hypothetical protein
MRNPYILAVVLLVASSISSQAFAMADKNNAELRTPSPQSSHLVAYQQLSKLLGSSLYQRMLESDDFIKIQGVILQRIRQLKH